MRGEDFWGRSEVSGMLGLRMGLVLLGCLLWSCCRTVAVMSAVPLVKRDVIVWEYTPTFTRSLAFYFFGGLYSLLPDLAFVFLLLTEVFLIGLRFASLSFSVRGQLLVSNKRRSVRRSIEACVSRKTCTLIVFS